MQDLYLTINFDTRSLQCPYHNISFNEGRGGGSYTWTDIWEYILFVYSLLILFQTIAHTLKGQKYFALFIFLYNPLQTFCFKNFTKCFFKFHKMFIVIVIIMNFLQDMHNFFKIIKKVISSVIFSILTRI